MYNNYRYNFESKSKSLREIMKNLKRISLFMLVAINTTNIHASSSNKDLPETNTSQTPSKVITPEKQFLKPTTTPSWT